MYNSGIYQPTRVITKKGIMDLNDILPGDYVYEYKTSKPLKVKEVITPNYIHNTIYRVTFNDRRVVFFQKGDKIFTGENVVPIESIHLNHSNISFKQYALCYKNKVTTPLDPDPYLAAPFLIFGSYEDEYINLPANMYGINNVFANKHSVEYADTYNSKNGNRARFQYIGTNERITWKSFFNSNKNNLTTRNMKMFTIPDIYTKASIKDRIQFIRGVFDAGYDPNLFGDNTVGIVTNSDHRLHDFQRMLWSVGILSKIELDYNIDKVNGNKYKLTIIGDYHGYPGFTYVLDRICNLLDKDNEIIEYHNELSVKVDNVRRMDYYGYKQNIILEKLNCLYLTDNHIPLLSL